MNIMCVKRIYYQNALMAKDGGAPEFCGYFAISEAHNATSCEEAF